MSRRWSFASVVLLVAPLAAAQNVQLEVPRLPTPEPTAPALLFGPGDVATLVARKTNAAFQPNYTQTKSFVDGRLAGLASNASAIDDDTLSRAAKGAALLQQLGETPSASFTSYRDAAVRALRAIRSRSPGNPVFPPSDPIDPLQDSSRLQSMVEAYDMLRGTGVASADDTAIRESIAKWAEALRQDLNLTGAFGVQGHRDNWGIKAGSALVTCAMGLPSHAKAANWLSFGMTLLNESFAQVGSATGWHREGPHYMNYSLANLVTTAVEVQRRASVDWFDDLRPFVRFALDTHQPDGSMAPFEEGVPNVFPFDVLAARYPDLGGEMAWVWNRSAKDPVNFDNQALHQATRFLLADLPAEIAPTGSPTRFIGADAHVQVLRSGWESDAHQLTMITARDHSSSTLTPSRHHMQNPLDVVLAGLGKTLLVTSGGGPQVTSSSNRNYYLDPASRNVPLVNRSAPFVTDGSKITTTARLDSRDDGGRRHRFLDVAKTTVTAYSGVNTVSRLAAMVDDTYMLLADDVRGGSAVDVALPVRGRGTRRAGSSSTELVRTNWEQTGVTLDLGSVSNSALSAVDVNGFFAPSWGREESIQAVEVRTRGNDVRVLSLLRGRAAGTPEWTLTDRSAGRGAALEIASGTWTDVVVFGPGGESTTGGDVETDGVMALVRRGTDGKVLGFAIVGGTRLAVAGVRLVEAAAPVTLSATMVDDALVATVSQDQSGPISFSLGKGALAGAAWLARLDGASLPGERFTVQADRFAFNGLTAPGSIRVEASVAPVLAPIGAQSGNEGELLEFTISATDADGTPPTYAMSSEPPLPAGATLDAATGVFRWTPGFDVASRAGAATFRVTFSASDGGQAATELVTVTVGNVNRAPVVEPIAPRSIEQGASLSLPMVGADPDGDPLAWSVTVTPETTPAPTISGGTLSWPISDDVEPGAYTVEVTASDDDLEASTELILTVQARPSGPDGGVDVDGGSTTPALDGGSGTTPDAGTEEQGATPADGCGCRGGSPGLLALLGLALALRRRGLGRR